MIKKAFRSTALPLILFVMAVLSAIFFRASRSNWVFINITLNFEYFTVVVLCLMALAAIILGVLSYAKIKKSDFCEKKAYKALLSAGGILSVISSIFALAYSIGLYFGENKEVYTLYLKKALSEGSLLLVIPFFAIFFPLLNKKVKSIVLALSLVFVAISGVNTFFSPGSFKITSEPTVIDNGEEYSVVFSTNYKGTAWVEYTYEGKDYKVYDHIGGRIIGDNKIHSVAIPYEHLRNNSYKVGSTKVIEEFSYGSRAGKTVVSDEYTLRYNDSDNQSWLVISDWHTMLDAAYKAIENLDSEYDGVILLGDATPGVDFEEQVITNIVEFGGKVSGGTKPVLYIRGNHETRGAYASKLPDALGLNQLYYTAEIGPYSFVVLDSGEDKDDSHIEYGGMTDYNTYRADMIEWLGTVETESDKVITLSHSWEISDVEEELSAQGFKELDRLGVRLLMSGHTHQCRFIGTAEGKEKEVFTAYPDIIGYMDGGKSGENYIASLLTLSSDGFEIKAADNNGNEILKESFTW